MNNDNEARLDTLETAPSGFNIGALLEYYHSIPDEHSIFKTELCCELKKHLESCIINEQNCSSLMRLFSLRNEGLSEMLLKRMVDLWCKSQSAKWRLLALIQTSSQLTAQHNSFSSNEFVTTLSNVMEKALAQLSTRLSSSSFVALARDDLIVELCQLVHVVSCMALKFNASTVDEERLNWLMKTLEKKIKIIDTKRESLYSKDVKNKVFLKAKAARFSQTVTLLAEEKKKLLFLLNQKAEKNLVETDEVGAAVGSVLLMGTLTYFIGASATVVGISALGPAAPLTLVAAVRYFKPSEESNSESVKEDVHLGKLADRDDSSSEEPFIKTIENLEKRYTADESKYIIKTPAECWHLVRWFKAVLLTKNEVSDFILSNLDARDIVARLLKRLFRRHLHNHHKLTRQVVRVRIATCVEIVDLVQTLFRRYQWEIINIHTGSDDINKEKFEEMKRSYDELMQLGDDSSAWLAVYEDMGWLINPKYGCTTTTPYWGKHQKRARGYLEAHFENYNNSKASINAVEFTFPGHVVCSPIDVKIKKWREHIKWCKDAKSKLHQRWSVVIEIDERELLTGVLSNIETLMSNRTLHCGTLVSLSVDTTTELNTGQVMCLQSLVKYGLQSLHLVIAGFEKVEDFGALPLSQNEATDTQAYFFEQGLPITCYNQLNALSVMTRGEQDDNLEGACQAIIHQNESTRAFIQKTLPDILNEARQCQLITENYRLKNGSHSQWVQCWLQQSENELSDLQRTFLHDKMAHYEKLYDKYTEHCPALSDPSSAPASFAQAAMDSCALFELGRAWSLRHLIADSNDRAFARLERLYPHGVPVETCDAVNVNYRTKPRAIDIAVFYQKVDGVSWLLAKGATALRHYERDVVYPKHSSMTVDGFPLRLAFAGKQENQLNIQKQLLALPDVLYDGLAWCIVDNDNDLLAGITKEIEEMAISIDITRPIVQGYWQGHNLLSAAVACQASGRLVSHLGEMDDATLEAALNYVLPDTVTDKRYSGLSVASMMLLLGDEALLDLCYDKNFLLTPSQSNNNNATTLLLVHPKNWGAIALLMQGAAQRLSQCDTNVSRREHVFQCYRDCIALIEKNEPEVLASLLTLELPAVVQTADDTVPVWHWVLYHGLWPIWGDTLLAHASTLSPKALQTQLLSTAMLSEELTTVTVLQAAFQFAPWMSAQDASNETTMAIVKLHCKAGCLADALVNEVKSSQPDSIALLHYAVMQHVYGRPDLLQFLLTDEECVQQLTKANFYFGLRRPLPTRDGLPESISNLQLLAALFYRDLSATVQSSKPACDSITACVEALITHHLQANPAINKEEKHALLREALSAAITFHNAPTYDYVDSIALLIAFDANLKGLPRESQRALKKALLKIGAFSDKIDSLFDSNQILQIKSVESLTMNNATFYNGQLAQKMRDTRINSVIINPVYLTERRDTMFKDQRDKNGQSANNNENTVEKEYQLAEEMYDTNIGLNMRGSRKVSIPKHLQTVDDYGKVVNSINANKSLEEDKLKKEEKNQKLARKMVRTNILCNAIDTDIIGPQDDINEGMLALEKERSTQNHVLQKQVDVNTQSIQQQDEQIKTIKIISLQSQAFALQSQTLAEETAVKVEELEQLYELHDGQIQTLFEKAEIAEKAIKQLVEDAKNIKLQQTIMDSVVKRLEPLVQQGDEQQLIQSLYGSIKDEPKLVLYYAMVRTMLHHKFFQGHFITAGGALRTLSFGEGMAELGAGVVPIVGPLLVALIKVGVFTKEVIAQELQDEEGENFYGCTSSLHALDILPELIALGLTHVYSEQLLCAPNRCIASDELNNFLTISDYGAKLVKYVIGKQKEFIDDIPSTQKNIIGLAFAIISRVPETANSTFTKKLKIFLGEGHHLYNPMFNSGFKLEKTARKSLGINWSVKKLYRKPGIKMKADGEVIYLPNNKAGESYCYRWAITDTERTKLVQEGSSQRETPHPFPGKVVDIDVYSNFIKLFTSAFDRWGSAPTPPNSSNNANNNNINLNPNANNQQDNNNYNILQKTKGQTSGSSSQAGLLPNQGFYKKVQSGNEHVLKLNQLIKDELRLSGMEVRYDKQSKLFSLFFILDDIDDIDDELWDTLQKYLKVVKKNESKNYRYHAIVPDSYDEVAAITFKRVQHVDAFLKQLSDESTLTMLKKTYDIIQSISSSSKKT